MALILGLNAYHADASAALLCDGRLVAAVEEERLRRVKHWGCLIFALCALFGFRWVMIENQLETVEDRLAQDVIELPTVFPAGWTDASRTGPRKR